MFNPRGGVVLLVALLLAAGCGGGRGLSPVERGKRTQLDGFSVVPPQGDRWYVAPTLPQSEVWRAVAGFVKQTPQDTSGAAVWATVAVANLDTAFENRDQLLQAAVRSRQTELQTGRFRLLEFRTSPGPLPACRRYDAVAEDRGVTQFPGVVFVLSLHHAICLHPNSPTLGINLAYNERRRQGQPATALEAEGEFFLASLEFAALSRPAVVATIEVQRDPQGVVADGRAVWVAELANGSVARIDPRTNSVAKRYPIGPRPVGLAISEGAVWVTVNGANEVWTIDVQADEVSGRPIKVGREPLDIAVGWGSVWVTNVANGTVSRIDPRTRQVIATIPVGSEPSGLAVGTTGVWVTDFGESRLWRIDPRTNQVAGPPISVGQGPSALVASPSGIWIASQSATLSRLDETRPGVAAITVGRSATGIAVVGQQIWVTDYLAGVIWRVDGATQKVINPSIPVGKGPLRLAVGSGAVWVTNGGNGTVSRIAGF